MRTPLVDQNKLFFADRAHCALERVIGASSHPSKGEHHNWKREVLAACLDSERGALKLPPPPHNFHSSRDVNGCVMDSNYQHSREGGSAPPSLSLLGQGVLGYPIVLRGEACWNSSLGLLYATLAEKKIAVLKAALSLFSFLNPVLLEGNYGLVLKEEVKLCPPQAGVFGGGVCGLDPMTLYTGEEKPQLGKCPWGGT